MGIYHHNPFFYYFAAASFCVRVFLLTNFHCLLPSLQHHFARAVRLRNVKWKIFTISFFHPILFFSSSFCLVCNMHTPCSIHQCNIVSMNDNYLYGTRLGMLLDTMISMNMHKHTYRHILTHTYKLHFLPP